MRRFLLLFPLLVSACMVDPASPTEDSLSGEITLAPSGENTRQYGVFRSSEFDYARTAAVAEAEFQRKSYHDAFGGFLAACDEEHPINCYRAADILDRYLFSHGPLSMHSVEAAQDLYNVACDRGVHEACERLLSEN